MRVGPRFATSPFIPCFTLKIAKLPREPRHTRSAPVHFVRSQICRSERLLDCFCWLCFLWFSPLLNLRKLRSAFPYTSDGPRFPSTFSRFAPHLATSGRP